MSHPHDHAALPVPREVTLPTEPATTVRLAWRAVPEGTPRRETAWALLRELLAPGTELTNPCPRCGGPHGPVRTTDASARPAVAYAGAVAVVAVADAGPGGFAIDAEAESDPVRDAAGLRGVLGTRTGVGLRDWVRTEAALKADSRGLRVDPGTVVITPVGTAAWHATVPGGAAVSGWDLDGPPGILVSVALSGGARAAGADPATR
ncbi:chemotaxis protein CheY [Microbacterium sp. BWT-B31]|uniref:chemotaxis protein CheY n=1 Tax=Microbacterium sp. BWT-B31 TaxID=3232072 RepID=UPI003529C4DA